MDIKVLNTLRNRFTACSIPNYVRYLHTVEAKINVAMHTYFIIQRQEVP